MANNYDLNQPIVNNALSTFGTMNDSTSSTSPPRYRASFAQRKFSQFFDDVYR